jgi:hypothetical protein
VILPVPPYPCPLAGPRPFTGGEEQRGQASWATGGPCVSQRKEAEAELKQEKRERDSSRAKGNGQWLSATFPTFSRVCTVPDGMAARAHTRHTTAALPSYGATALSNPLHQRVVRALFKRRARTSTTNAGPPSMPTIHLSVAKPARLPHEKLLAR